MIKFLYILALFLVKNANFFAKFFGENILKIITLVPGEFVKKSQKMSKLIHRYDRGKQ
jgi:hypothetical protein